jgi:hypothetical protein
MGKLAARLARLETLVPTLAYLETWLTILRETAQVAALDAATTETLLTAVEAHHQALRIPPLVEADQVPVLGQALLDGVLEAIAVHVPAGLQSAYRQATSELCLEASRRWQAVEEADNDATL